MRHRLTFAPRVFFLEVVRVDCEHPARAESYRRHGLAARVGADITVPDPLVAVASRDRRQDFTRPCGARFMELAARARVLRF